MNLNNLPIEAWAGIGTILLLVFLIFLVDRKNKKQIKSHRAYTGRLKSQQERLGRRKP